MELPTFNTYMNFTCHHFFVALQLLLCLFWISLQLGIGVHNTLASKICVKLLKPPKIQISMSNTSFRIC
jgi:hypothetical protein